MGGNINVRITKGVDMNRVRQIRVEKGLNQRELAEASHTPQSLISAIERGTLKPWPKVARRISEVLGTPVEDIFPKDKDELLRLAST